MVKQPFSEMLRLVDMSDSSSLSGGTILVAVNWFASFALAGLFPRVAGHFIFDAVTQISLSFEFDVIEACLSGRGLWVSVNN